MFCTSCGNEMPDDSKFCTGCGTVLGEGAETPIPPIQTPPPMQMAPEQKMPKQPKEPIPMPANFKLGMVMFEGKGGKLFGKLLGAYLLSLITFGIYAPWAFCKIRKFNLQNTAIDGKRFDFIGTGGGLWGQILIMWLLSAITICIYIPWGFCKLQRWMAENTVVTN